MSFSFINKILFLILIQFLIYSCSSKTVYDKFKIKKYDTLTVDDYDENKINVNNIYNKNLKNSDKITLNKFKNYNQYLNNVIYYNDAIYTYQKNKLYEFNYQTGELVSFKELNLSESNNDKIVSFHYIDNSFLLSFKSGLITRLNYDGDIIWQYTSEKLLNTSLSILNEQIIVLYSDEILSISLNEGKKIWSKTFNDLPIYQAKGGQLKNFLNILYFILPNNKIGSIDYDLGTMHNSNFDDIPIISSINNTNDKIHIYDKYLSYLDEGKYLYSFDIFKNEFILFKKTFDITSSNLFFNDSLILKEGDNIQALNILNGKTFWLIADKSISKSSKIIAVRNFDSNIEIYLNNGDVLIIKNKILIEKYNLDVGKINKISFGKDSIIVHTKSGKTVVF